MQKILWQTRNTERTISPQPYAYPPKSKCHDGQSWINETGRLYSENTALFTMLRGGMRIKA